MCGELGVRRGPDGRGLPLLTGTERFHVTVVTLVKSERLDISKKLHRSAPPSQLESLLGFDERRLVTRRAQWMGPSKESAGAGEFAGCHWLFMYRCKVFVFAVAGDEPRDGSYLPSNGPLQFLRHRKKSRPFQFNRLRIRRLGPSTTHHHQRCDTGYISCQLARQQTRADWAVLIALPCSTVGVYRTWASDPASTASRSSLSAVAWTAPPSWPLVGRPP